VLEPVRIDDPEDPRIADYVGLTDPELRRRIEGEQGFFIAESPHVVRRLLESGRTVRSVLTNPSQFDALADALAPAYALRPFPAYVAETKVLKRVVGFDLHRGAVASAQRWVLPAADEVLRDARRVLVLEKVNDHENLGLLFRSAAALGIDAVLLDRECSDPLYRRTVRVSIGTAITLPWTRIDTLDELAGFTTVALTPAEGAVPIDEVRWTEPLALLVGAEGPGLSDAWLQRAAIRVQIPMEAGVDSLNVATAASIAMHVSRNTSSRRVGR
jgi:tRNA G18 (ribose-2'-O)-methylase SpoU